MPVQTAWFPEIAVSMLVTTGICSSPPCPHHNPAQKTHLSLNKQPSLQSSDKRGIFKSWVLSFSLAFSQHSLQYDQHFLYHPVFYDNHWKWKFLVKHKKHLSPKKLKLLLFHVLRTSNWTALRSLLWKWTDLLSY